ncbi:MAG: CDP-glycerol glycerophosphotransferase family protein [Clostridium sp.]
MKLIIDKLLKIILKGMSNFVKTDKKTIIFIAYHGRGYICNPKYIHREMIKDKRFEKYNLIWALRDKKIEISGAQKVRYNSIKYFYILLKSKYWISNCKLPSYYVKKKDQVYIQTWHGVPLKRLAHDIKCKEGTTFYRSKLTREEMLKTYDEDSKKYDYFISPNKYATEIFKSCFKINQSIIKEIGYPRNEILTNHTVKDVSRIKKELGIEGNKKVLLYTPTWRDNQFDMTGYKISLKADFDRWRKEIGRDWVVLFKPHYLIKMKFDFKEVKDFIYVIDENYDIANLYIISDMLVTDYSSTFFDYKILNRPIAFYMYDKKEYKDEIRGFYMAPEELPGPIFEDEESLLEYIKKNNIDSSFNKKNNYELSSKTIIEEIILGVE